MTILLRAALKRIADLENEIGIRQRPLGEIMAERARRVEHARALLWHQAQAEGIIPSDKCIRDLDNKTHK